MNLVPDEFSESSLNYWCTWGAQHPRYRITTDEEWKAFNLKGVAVENAMRNRMDQEALFGGPGWATKFWPELRSELYFCLDDGWDVPYDVNAHAERWRFGSLILDEKRFPDFKGTPAERLKRLNDKIKGLGWRGLALWVAAQCEGDDRDGQFASPEVCEAYWRDRVRWSAEAGIEYWKVDWGVRNTDLSFRRMLTNFAREEAPNLTVEHALCMMPANNITGSGRFGDWADFATPSTEILNFSDAFRRYDVMGNGLGIASALDRIDTWLEQAHMEPTARGIINCEDDVYLGAAMGGALGILCVPMKNPYTKWQWPRVDEVSRALRWQRIAPAFGVGAAKAFVSKRVLTDCNTVGVDYWYREVAGKVVAQHAPAVMSRGVALPTVICDGEPPYVVASRHPHGATAVATLRRCVDGKMLYPLADVTLDVQDMEHPIGVFGSFRTLTLCFPQALSSSRVWAQDLLADKAQDVTHRVKIAGHSLILDGALIEQLGRAAATESDPSDPGLILKLEKSVY